MLEVWREMEVGMGVIVDVELAKKVRGVCESVIGRGCFTNELPWEDRIRTPVKASRYEDGSVEVIVGRMYDAIPITFALLEGLAEVFGTREFKMDFTSESGCETCDFGSKYCVVFEIPGGVK